MLIDTTIAPIQQDGHAKKKHNSRISGSKGRRANAARLSDIFKIIAGRHGGVCLDDAMGRRYFFAALPHLIGNHISFGAAVRRWTMKHLPALAIMYGPEWIEAETAKCAAKRKKRYPSTDRLSKLLQVADFEPMLLGLRAIPAASRTKAIREADDKARRSESQHRRRTQKPGHRPHSQSLNRIKPWLAEGVSRSRWYADRKTEKLSNLSILDENVPLITGAPDTVNVEPPLDENVPLISFGGAGQIRAPHQREHSANKAIKWKDTLSELIAGAEQARNDWYAFDPFFLAIDAEMEREDREAGAADAWRRAA